MFRIYVSKQLQWGWGSSMLGLGDKELGAGGARLVRSRISSYQTQNPSVHGAAPSAAGHGVNTHGNHPGGCQLLPYETHTESQRAV